MKGKIKKALIFIWFPISLLMNAIDLINLKEDLWPATVKWIGFFERLFELVEALKDKLLLPIEYFFDISIPVLVKTYVFIGIIIATSHFLGSKFSAGIFMTSIKRRIITSILMGMVWPFFFIGMLASPILVFKNKSFSRDMMTHAIVMSFYMVMFLSAVYFALLTLMIALIFGVNSVLN